MSARSCDKPSREIPGLATVANRRMNSFKRDSFRGDFLSLLAVALAVLVLHCLTNHNYGFHRDELATLDDSRYLASGYVAYPPVTPAFGRLALELFGPPLAGFRFFTALAAVASAGAPTALSRGALFQYVAFDGLWWVLISYLLVRLLKRDDPRGWLPVGAVIDIGMLTKYTMGFLALALALAVLLTATRRHLRSPWLWAGVGLSILIFLPNLLWQSQHEFVSLEFLNHIHARDVKNGRAANFFIQQIYVCTSIVAVPLWLTGLYFYLWAPAGRPYRLLGWLYVITLGFFALAGAAPADGTERHQFLLGAPLRRGATRRRHSRGIFAAMGPALFHRMRVGRRRHQFLQRRE